MPARIVGGIRRSAKGRRPIFSHRLYQKDVTATTTSNKVKSNPEIHPEETMGIQNTDSESIEAETDENSPRSVATDIFHINSAFDQRRLPVYAFPLLEQITNQSRNYQMKLFFLNVQIIPLTVLAIAAAVFYGRKYHGYPDVHDLVGLALWFATILLPLYIACLVPIRKNLGPMDPFRKVAATLESQIYLFRLGVSPFEDAETCQTSFQKSAQSLWNLTHSSQHLPEEFWKDEKLETGMPILEEEPQDQSTKDDLTIYLELPFPPQPRKNDLVDLEAAESTEMSPMLKNDNRSALSEEDYRIYRLEHVIKSKMTRIQSLEFRVKALQRIIQLLTMGATGTAIVSMQWIIPIILALATAGGSILEASSYQRSIAMEKASVEKLEKFLQQWEQNTELPKTLAIEVESAILDSISQ